MIFKRRHFSTLFLVLTSIFITCLLLSNIIAGKLITLWGVVLPAAVIIFPITYLLGDIFTEVYGYERTRLVIWLGFAANILMSAIMVITIALPYPGFWTNQAAYETVLGFTPRLVFASLLAYLAGEFSNAFVLSKVKILTRGRFLWIRTIGSTLLGQALDTVVFITVAFVGLIPSSVLLGMILAQYIWKVLYEVVATPLTYLVVGWIKRKEGIDTFDYQANYNPFRWEESDETN